jgi:hypothetical protein
MSASDTTLEKRVASYFIRRQFLGSYNPAGAIVDKLAGAQEGTNNPIFSKC